MRFTSTPENMLRKIARLPTIGILGVAFGIWVLGFFIISPIFQDIGYLAFLQWEMISPTLITLFLYVRAVRRADSRNKRIQLHVAWLVTLAVVIYLGRETWIGYQAMDDAPRGLLWDIYQFLALAFGASAFWICYACGLLFTQKTKPRESGRGDAIAPVTPPRPPDMRV